MYEVLAEFKIDGLSFTELTSIVRNLGMFTSNLTSMIHSGMDADDMLEYNDIVPEIGTINGYDASELIEDDDNSAETKLESSFTDGMLFEYLVKCEERYHCTLYIVDEELYNRTILEVFVTEQLVSYFVNTNANTGTSSVMFTVDSLTLNEISKDATYSENTSEASIFMMIVAALLIVSICALTLVILCLLRRKRKHGPKGRNAESFAANTTSPGDSQVRSDPPTSAQSPGSTESTDTVDIELTEHTEQYGKEGMPATGVVEDLNGTSNGIFVSGTNQIGVNPTLSAHHDDAHSRDEFELQYDTDESGSTIAGAVPVSSDNVATPNSIATPGSGTAR